MSATTSTNASTNASSSSRSAARGVSLLNIGQQAKPQAPKVVEISVLDRVNPDHPACKESVTTVLASGEVEGKTFSWTNGIALTLATGQGRGPLVLAIDDISPSIQALKEINVDRLRAEMQGKQVILSAAENIKASAKMIVEDGKEYVTFSPSSGRGNKVQRIPAEQFSAFVLAFEALMNSYLPALEQARMDEAHAYNVALAAIEIARQKAEAEAAAAAANTETSPETSVETSVEASAETSTETSTETSVEAPTEVSAEESKSLSELSSIPTAPVSEKKSRGRNK